MKEILYHGYEQTEITINDRNAIIVKPKGKKNGKWVLKTEYFDALPKVQLELLSKGYHLAYSENITRWYNPDDTKAHKELARYMHDELGLDKKCVIIGMSCGGMKGIYFASEYPELVSCMYLDAPVVNFLSCPFALGKAECANLIEEFTKHTGRTLVDMLTFRNHPFDKISTLTSHKIPLILICGDSDKTVPFEENGLFLKEAYEKTDCDFEFVLKENSGHHPHSLEDNTPIIDFICRY
jgi:pimeloyl-ACP methyl ester carboxylesterase